MFRPFGGLVSIVRTLSSLDERCGGFEVSFLVGPFRVLSYIQVATSPSQVVECDAGISPPLFIHPRSCNQPL